MFFLGSCKHQQQKTAQEIIDESIVFYGGDRWNELHLDFQFRKHQYSLYRTKKGTVYTRTTLEEPILKDSLFSSGRFIRYQDGAIVSLSDSLQQVYSESVNSVLYFFQIPKVLNDKAVLKSRLADQEIEGKHYHSIKISFQKEGGGTDFEDEFRYWIDTETAAIDYLAYNYLTNGGGTRFRKVNKRIEKNGMRFQDYLNYKPLDKKTPLDSLPTLFELEQLIQLSIIENKTIRFRDY